MDLRTIFWHVTLLCVIKTTREECIEKQQEIYLYPSAIECTDLDTSSDIEMSINATKHGWSINKIEIRNSKLTTLNANLFGSLNFRSNVFTLVVHNTALKVIEPFAFNNLSHLKYLSLTNSYIPSIVRDVFNNITNLESLDLSNNSIKSIESRALLGTKIKYIHLEHNRIEDMSPIVENCSTYQALCLDFNDITTIPSLINCTSLRTLNISNNKIVRLQKDILPRGLTLLSLRNNQIETIAEDTFADFGIDEKSFAFSPNHLYSLDLSNNNLHKLLNGGIPQWLFQNLKSLRNLNLSSNHLSNLKPGTFRNLNSLSTLDLGYNNLTYISSGLLSHIQLQLLSIHHNQLTELENVFYIHKKGTTFLMDDNPWSCDFLARKIYLFISLNPLNKLVIGNYINRPNANSTKCSRLYQSNADLVEKLHKIEGLQPFREKIYQFLNDVKDLLQNTSKQSFIHSNDAIKNSNSLVTVYNMVMEIAENTQQLQRITKKQEFQQNVTEAESRFQRTLELSKIRILLLWILVTTIILIVLILTVCGFVFFKYKQNTNMAIPIPL